MFVAPVYVERTIIKKWRMDFQAGDHVATETGLHGRIVHVSRLSAFVELQLEGGKEIVPFLLSELFRVDPPENGLAGPSIPQGPTD